MTEYPEHETTPAPVKEHREPYLPLTLAGLAGPLCWVLHFALVYLLEGFLCSPGSSSPQLIIASIFVATLVFAGSCLFLVISSKYWIRLAGGDRTQTSGFLVSINRLLAGLSCLAILWATTGVFFLSPCVAGY